MRPPGWGDFWILKITRGPYAPSRERARFGSEFVSALRRDFQQGGPAAIAKVRKYQPAAYMKICALVIPKATRCGVGGAARAVPRRRGRGLGEVRSLWRSRLLRRSPPRLHPSTSKNTGRIA